MIHVIGASGFIGRAVAKAGANRSDILYYSSNKDFAATLNGGYFSLAECSSWNNLEIKEEDRLIFLPWRNLPNYTNPIHLTENLTECLRFFEYLATTALKKIVIAGTCYEYGLQNGQLPESLPTKPVNCYAVAKDALRSMAESLFTSSNIGFAWLRIFYPFGDGQNPNSLLPSLIRAIENGDRSFDTSQGDQIRDFIHVDEVADIFIKVADSDSATGVYNVGSGNPMSIRDFLESHIRSRQSSIQLNLGVYPRRKDEPLAFWADRSALDAVLSTNTLI